MRTDRHAGRGARDATADPERVTPGVVLCRLSWRWIERLDWLLRAVHTGLFLGGLSPASLRTLDSSHHARSRTYTDPGYNRSGLYPWERAAVEELFPPGCEIAVLGAGAGRELLGLHAMGYRVTGFECNPALRARGREILREADPGLRLLPMEPDSCPAFPGRPGGVILGWGMYSLVRGRATRVRLLRRLREAVPPAAPLLLSFVGRAAPRWFWAVARGVSGPLRPLLGRPPVEVGDLLLPHYIHTFTEEEVRAELAEGGWEPRDVRWTPYPHALARARRSVC